MELITQNMIFILKAPDMDVSEGFDVYKRAMGKIDKEMEGGFAKAACETLSIGYGIEILSVIMTKLIDNYGNELQLKRQL